MLSISFVGCFKFAERGVGMTVLFTHYPSCLLTVFQIVTKTTTDNIIL